MSFYSDFIDLVDTDLKLLPLMRADPTVKLETYKKAVIEMAPFRYVAERMRLSKIIRLGGSQSTIFLDSPILDGQNYIDWFRLPFPNIYVQLEQPIPFTGYVQGHEDDLARSILTAPNRTEFERLKSLAAYKGDPMIRGVLVTEDPRDYFQGATIENQTFETWCQQSEITPDSVLRMVTVCFLMPLPDYPMNIHGLTIGVTDDNRIVSRHERSPGIAPKDIQIRMHAWVVHLVNFLSSPSVKLIANAPAPALQKARQKRGKEPLPGWYEIVWRKEIKEYTRDKFSPKRWEHSYRYDVRGHQRLYKVGPMAGRVVWVSAHQRGLKNQLYKPAVRSIG